MAIYRFRVTYEDHEEIYRDIDIKSSQTFSDFHCAIQNAIDFDNSKSAVWYMSDDYWRKEKEIGTVNDSSNSKNKKAHKIKIAEFIDDPHQKFLYIFDPENEWTFCVELIKIILDDPDYTLPKCVKTAGAAPKQYKPTNLPPPIEEEEDEDKNKEKEKIFVSEEAYDEDESEEEEDAIIEGENEEFPEGEIGEEEAPQEDVEE